MEHTHNRKREGRPASQEQETTEGRDLMHGRMRPPTSWPLVQRRKKSLRGGILMHAKKQLLRKGSFTDRKKRPLMQRVATHK